MERIKKCKVKENGVVCGREKKHFEHTCHNAPNPDGPERKYGCPVHDNVCDHCGVHAQGEPVAA